MPQVVRPTFLVNFFTVIIANFVKKNCSRSVLGQKCTNLRAGLTGVTVRKAVVKSFVVKLLKLQFLRIVSKIQNAPNFL